MLSSVNLVLLVATAVPWTTLACINGKLPKSNSSKSLKKPQYIAAGETFDGRMTKYDRGSGACRGGEGGEDDTVFVLESGATLRNVIIGADQMEGVYCIGDGCTLENVWFEGVCEDAISIKGGGTATIRGGGAFDASDKVIQHNGCGHVDIIGFYAKNYGKMYRSCGNCANNCARTVHMEGCTGVHGGELMGINPNLGDKATYSNNCADGIVCEAYDGCPGKKCEPKKVGEC